MRAISHPRDLGRRAQRVLASAAVLMLLASSSHAAELLDLLKQPGAIALMRHAPAPFEGAPSADDPNLNRLDDCSTQRNLDDRGRADARRIRAVFERAGVRFEHVYTSAWCRCQETADLIIGTKVQVLPWINSFFRKPERGPEQLAGLRKFILEFAPGDRALFVTHGSLISAMTGINTAETEVVILARDGQGGFKVVGRGTP